MTIRRLAFICIILTYFLIVFGGYVASSESGMGCGPEWPLCNGKVFPTLRGETLIEFLHRGIGAILGIMSLILFIKLMRRKIGYTARFVSVMMLGLLIIQVLLGAVVVVLDLPPIIITIHLLTAMLFMACLIWIWRYSETEGQSAMKPLKAKEHRKVIMHLNILLFLLFLTLAFGAYIKHETYGLACGWLDCKQSFLPAAVPELLQSIHRGLAVISAVHILLLTYLSYSKGWGRSLRRRLMFCTLMVVLQMIIGAVVIKTFVAVPWAVFHLAIATALFTIVSEARVYAGAQIMQWMSYRAGDRKWNEEEHERRSF
ncbi:COX15/CtaA family protein [Neobacillus mesonae]|uniref:COX15/CtaA family protein n=1 Tax=Neobacillus mesonae TaxID=1193713 RepID=UPI00203EAA32|nr:COX15/CtaA family protein [Neobacillus mesonae]MCM3569732.1 COX15/CtaA family protein [Neobacillus mesonae]